MADEESEFQELPEEEQPESLRKKWEAEDLEDETGGRQTAACPHCGKWIEKRSLTCLYCGEKVFYKSGLLGNIVGMIKGRHIFGVNLFLVLLSVIIILGLVIF